MIRTYHDGMKNLSPRMLFNVENDPHELHNLADKRPEIVNEAQKILDEWHAEMMTSATHPVDPLWTVMKEGGPFHTRGELSNYCRRLRETGREMHAEKLEKQYGSQ